MYGAVTYKNAKGVTNQAVAKLRIAPPAQWPAIQQPKILYDYKSPR